jgi:hypothetical protein
MGGIVAAILAALFGPFLFVAVYLGVAHLANWPAGPAADGFVLLGGVLAGVAPIFLARGALWIRVLLAAIYAFPCAYAVAFYTLLLSCSMFRQCLS